MAALVVVLLVVAVYMQSLGGPFLWDDRLLVLDAPLVEHGGSLGDFLKSPFWAGGSLHGESTSYYRPLVTLSFAVDRALHGGNSAGYHLTNVVLHATNAILFLALLKKHGVRAATAGLLAAGWALLPRLAEAAAWISGRTDLLAALFTLSALCVWGSSPARRVGAALLVGVGLLAKESALAGALAIAASAWVGARPAPAKQRLGRVLVELAPLLVVLAVIAVLRFRAVGFESRGETLGAAGRLRTIFEAVGTYAAMLADPFRPRAVIGRVGAPSVAALAAGIAVSLACVALIRARARPGVASATGLALFAGALVPVVHIVPIPLLTLAADRFLYVPAAGLVLALAPAVERLLGGERLRWLGAVALVGALGVVSFQRVGVWSDELEFWVETYVETPATNAAAANELAGVYYRGGLYDDARILSERSLRYDDPRRTTAHYNAGLCLARLGQGDRARVELEAARGKRRWASDIELLLAFVEIRGGRFDAARAILTPLARSGNADARVLVSKLGELERARRELERLGPSGPPPLRARLAMLIDDEVAAFRAWNDVLRMPNLSKPLASGALEFFVQRGDREALARAASTHQARFGAIEPGLRATIDVRLAELDRLILARARVGLSGPERTREIAVSAR